MESSTDRLGDFIQVAVFLIFIAILASSSLNIINQGVYLKSNVDLNMEEATVREFRTSANNPYFASGSDIIATIMNDTKSIAYIVKASNGSVLGTFVDLKNLRDLHVINVKAEFQKSYLYDHDGSVMSIVYKQQ